MIHGPAAACLLCHRFQVRKNRYWKLWHCIALQMMQCPLAKIVYIADKLEPLRNRAADADEKMQTLDLDSLFAYTLTSVVKWFSNLGDRFAHTLPRYIAGCQNYERLEIKILKRSSLPLLVILIVVAIGLFFVVKLTEKGTVESIIKKDQPMAILFIFESDKNLFLINF